MIDPKELRIGNLIYNQSVVVAADGRTIFDLAYFEKPQYQPIQITPEWLERFGFEKEPNTCWIHPLEPMIYLSDESESYEDSYYFRYVIDKYSPGHIYYIHQLQNLYFALTGTELTLIK